MEAVSPEPLRSKIGRRIKKFLVFFFLILLFLFSGIVYWKYFYTYSSGNRYGLLQKFSRKGNIFKTNEGEMILSSIRGNNNMVIASEKFFFSVPNKEVADKLMHLQGRYITVHYKEKNGILGWRGDTPYIVDSIEIEGQPY